MEIARNSPIHQDRSAMSVRLGERKSNTPQNPERRISVNNTAKSQFGLVRFLKIDDIKPSPENDKLYRPIDPKDPSIIALADSISEHGIKEPLVVTIDYWILSGHRRYAAAKIAGIKKVPIRFESINRADDQDAFVKLLREYNRQREKTLDEKIREEVVSCDPEEAYESLIEHRKDCAEIQFDGFTIRDEKQRSAISNAKQPFIQAIIDVVEHYKEFAPLSVRFIHYKLLNYPPLKHARKPDSTYRNQQKDYKSLDELITRARLIGQVSWELISDSTRPVIVWNAWPEARGFISKSLEGFLKGYWRDLMQSQPNHVEIVGEKNTIQSIIRPIAMEYCIPLTIGRGFCSLPPRYDMAMRFKKSGKESLIILVVSDFDPEGEEIAHSFARSMRDDFGIKKIVPIKVALTAEQVREYELPPQMNAKQGSVNLKRFESKHGNQVFELEALEPADLQRILREKIDEVIDVEKFNQELDLEKDEAGEIEDFRRRAVAALGEFNGGTQ